MRKFLVIVFIFLTYTLCYSQGNDRNYEVILKNIFYNIESYTDYFTRADKTYLIETNEKIEAIFDTINDYKLVFVRPVNTFSYSRDKKSFHVISIKPFNIIENYTTYIVTFYNSEKKWKYKILNSGHRFYKFVFNCEEKTWELLNDKE